MAIFSVSFAAHTMAAARDSFRLTAPSDSRIAIRHVHLGQYSDFADAQAEILSVQHKRGTTFTAGNGGDTGVPVNWDGGSSLADNDTLVVTNDTGVAADTGTGNIKTPLATAWNIQAPYEFNPEPDARPVLAAGEEYVVSLSAPADAITINGTIIYERLGLMSRRAGG